MSDVTDALLGLAVETAKKIAKKALQWGVDELRTKAKEHGIELDEAVAESLLTAHLASLYATTWIMQQSIESDAQKLADAEAKFRASSNVTVVDSMDAPANDNDGGSE